MKKVKELKGVYMIDFDKDGKPDINWVSFNNKENKHIKKVKLKRMIKRQAKRLVID